MHRFITTLIIILSVCIGTPLSYADNNAISTFLNNVGISADTDISTKFEADWRNAYCLSPQQMRKILPGAVPFYYFEDNDTAGALISGIRGVTDSIVVVQIMLEDPWHSGVFITTYSTAGILKDSMFTGYGWSLGDAETNDEAKGTERIYETTTSCDFSTANVFALTLTTRQYEKEYAPEKETVLYRYRHTTNYRISECGIIDVISYDIEKYETSNGWCDDESLFVDLIGLDRIDKLPISDNERFCLYNKFGERMFGRVAYEDLFDGIYNFAYAFDPGKLLVWIYNNRDNDITTFTSVLSDKYEKFDDVRKAMRRHITELDNTEAKNYWLSILEDWDKHIFM